MLDISLVLRGENRSTWGKSLGNGNTMKVIHIKTIRSDMGNVYVYSMYIYLLGKYLIPPLLGRATTTRKERRLKNKWEERRSKGARDREQKFFLNPGNWCVHRGGRKELKKEERTRERASNSATMDHSVTFYDPHWSYSEPIILLLFGKYLTVGSTPGTISLRNTEQR